MSEEVPQGSGYVPDWAPAPGVRAWMTTRPGGASAGPWGMVGNAGRGFNLGMHCGDDPAAVASNRAALLRRLPRAPRWLSLVHGAQVADAEAIGEVPPTADAAVATEAGVVCCVTVADCLPVMLADRAGRAVGVAHAGWRGLAAGIVERTAERMRLRLRDPGADLQAWLGPAIGPLHFEVGDEVAAAFRARYGEVLGAVLPAEGAARGQPKCRLDLFAYARTALQRCGVAATFGGGECTYSQPERYYSFRRDGITGRHAALIWIDDAAR